MILSIIVAMDRKRGIGKNNKLPWHLHSDLVRFKTLTMGHHLMVGRKTYESIGKPLPGRNMIIVTRDKKFHSDGIIVVSSVDEAIRVAENNNETELFIIGGGEIFELTLSLANKIYLTEILADVAADTFFPIFDESNWKIVWFEECQQHEKDDFPTNFKILVREIENGVDKNTNPLIIRQT